MLKEYLTGDLGYVLYGCTFGQSQRSVKCFSLADAEKEKLAIPGVDADQGHQISYDISQLPT